MPTPLAKGVILAATVIVAAGVAAYENPQIREWLERSSQKLATAMRSLGDDIQRRPPFTRRQDSSMREDTDERAEDRRRQARADILERGRIMEERKKRRKFSQTHKGRTPSFDSLVDDDGMLKEVGSSKGHVVSVTSSEMREDSGHLRSRGRNGDMSQSIDAPIQLRQLQSETKTVSNNDDSNPWESRYEQELRRSWNITLPSNPVDLRSSHASESLIDLTPTTEDFPDPEISIPSLDENPSRDRSLHSPTRGSQSSKTLSEAGPEYYYAHPSQPMQPVEPRLMSQQEVFTMPGSSAASAAGSAVHITRSEGETDDDFSDFGDGIRTPASAWTEVGSSVSGDA